MSWIDDFIAAADAPQAKGTGFYTERYLDSRVEPVSLDDALSHGYLGRATAAQQADLTKFLKAARVFIERYTNKSMIQQSYYQYFDRVHNTRGLPLYKGPVPILAVNAVQYIANWTADTWLTWPSTQYAVVRGQQVVARYGFPAFRNAGGIRVDFKVGYATLATLDADPVVEAANVATARAAIPSDLTTCVKNLAQFLFENREGQGVEPKYEVIARSNSALPSGLMVMLDSYKDRRFMS